MYVRECCSCGYVIGDPNHKLDGYRYNSWCLKCRSSHMKYRLATMFEEIKMLLRLADVYREK
jgi:hypothetical protein